MSYVLWCGHTLCKNCIIGLQWTVVKFPTLSIQLPLFISYPWCNLLSFRLKNCTQIAVVIINNIGQLKTI
ncbi:hypothetical protein AHAS_Ahas11G0093100 [Arachis hypogaea]